MNCSDVSQLLEKMIFEEGPVNAGLGEHIADCPTCAEQYRDALRAREVMENLRRPVPMPGNPDELTENIMFAIRQESRETKIIPLLQRILAAASVALFLLFGVEQYGVVKNVSDLEAQLSETRIESTFPDPQKLAAKYDINRAGISLAEIRRLI
jgi:hypothetical protein